MGDRAAHPAVLRACAKDLHDTLVTVPFTEWALCYGPRCVRFLQRTHAVAQACLEAEVDPRLKAECMKISELVLRMVK